MGVDVPHNHPETPHPIPGLDSLEQDGRARDRNSLVDLDSTFLPIDQMRHISRITLLDGPEIRGEVDLGSGHWVYEQHFPGDPVFPGSLMIEAAGQLVALWAWANGHRGRPRLARVKAEFRNPVGVEDPHLFLRGTVRQRRHLCFGTVQVIAAGREVAGVTIVLAVVSACPGT